MSAPHDVPSMGQLVRAVIRFISNEVVPQLEGRSRYLGRVAVNALRIVEREIALGHAHETAHRERLRRLGFDSDEELSRAIRAERISLDDQEIVEAIRESVRAKLAVANPDYLEEEYSFKGPVNS